MTAIDRFHETRRAADQAAAVALDRLQLAVTVLKSVPPLIGSDDDPQLDGQRREMVRIAGLYGDPRLIDHIACDQIIDRLSEGLA